MDVQRCESVRVILMFRLTFVSLITTVYVRRPDMHQNMDAYPLD